MKELAEHWRFRPRWVETVFLLLVCSALAAAAAAAFPTLDDAYLNLLLRENGPQGVFLGHQDRPVLAMLLRDASEAFGRHFWTFAFLANVVLWTTLGVQTCILWRLMMPAWSEYAIVAGLLSVAPIVVRIQLVTATVTLFGVLSVVQVYGGLLTLVGALGRSSRGGVALGLLLCALGVLLTEYAVAASCAVAVLLVFAFPELYRGERRLFVRCALAILLIAALAYVFFLVISDLGDRPEVDPRRRIDRASIEGFPFSLLTSVWQVLIGSYGTSFGKIWMERDSGTSIAAVVFGLAIAGVVAWILRRRNPAELPDPRRIRMLPLLAAVVAGIAPVALMRPYSPIDFATRFYLPVLSPAVVLTLGGLLWSVKPRFRLAPVLSLAFIAGAALFRESVDDWRHQRRMDAAGRVIRGALAPEGLTAVVVSSSSLCEASDWCTGQATRAWPVDLERRVWIFDPLEGRKF
ncbi:MAG TPA: hypothetical protein VGH97_02265, partial [Thermoanaerobaculia bacterium]